MNFDLIEPLSAYERRLGIRPTFSPPPITPTPCPLQKTPLEPYRRRGDDFWVTAIFDELAAYGEAMRITSVVNLAARAGNYTSRLAYDSKRVALFQLISGLIKERRLIRVKRNFVALPEPNTAPKPLFRSAL